MSIVGRTFGERLRRRRDALGLSQEELGLRVHLSRAMIGHFEAGRRIADVEQAAALADALGVSVGSLVGEEPERPSVEERAVSMIETAIEGIRGTPVRHRGVVPADRMCWAALKGDMASVRVLSDWVGTRSPDEFLVVEAAGDCLLASHGIVSGNWVLIDRARRVPQTGEVVLVRLGDEFSLKIWRRLGEILELVTADGTVAYRGPLNAQVMVEGVYVTDWRPTARERAALAAQRGERAS